MRSLLESFKTFPVLQKLDLQLNSISSIEVSNNDFAHLEVLDLSYNNVNEAGILALGTLPILKRLYLTGNGLKDLPKLMSKTFNTYDR